MLTLATSQTENLHSTSKYKRSRAFVYDLLHTVEIETRLEHWVRIFIGVLIFLSMLSVVLESVEELHAEYYALFYGFEIFTVAIFSLEYLLRVWSVVERPGYESPILGRIRYIVSLMALVDLIAVAPFYLPALTTLDLRFLRGLRLIRLTRVLKLGHYSHSMAMISRVVRRKRHEMGAAVFIVAILLVFSSSLMYYIEHEAQPKVFTSIPAALWWGIATLTTVGYGDIYPITPLGKICSALISLLGIGVVALPSGLFVAGFVEELQAKQASIVHTCPTCQTEFTEPAS